MRRIFLLLTLANCTATRGLPIAPAADSPLARVADLSLAAVADALSMSVDADAAPRTIACGVRPCNLDANEACCVDVYDLPSQWGCSVSCQETGRRCDGPEDCDGNPCCEDVSRWGSSCAPDGTSDCSPGRRLCRTAADCGPQPDSGMVLDQWICKAGSLAETFCAHPQY